MIVVGLPFWCVATRLVEPIPWGNGGKPNAEVAIPTPEVRTRGAPESRSPESRSGTYAF